MRKLYVTAAVFAILCFSMVAAAQQAATKEECVIKCHEAAALINSKGLDEAIKEISDPKGPFVWKDSYVFLMNMEGKMLAHPMQPELTKLPHCLLITDPTDKALFVSFVNLAKTVGHGWVEYMWPRPGHKSPSKKITYIYRVPGKDLFVGAGVYVGGMMY
ncbi:MAG: cache domain-containing protein [Deltaproteobacteria bacterium]|nr:cache domain-containing protein [Deltaproteobacteria bacterium]